LLRRRASVHSISLPVCIVLSLFRFVPHALFLSFFTAFFILHHRKGSLNISQCSFGSFYVLRRIEKPHANKICLFLVLSYDPGPNTQDRGLTLCLLCSLVLWFLYFNRACSLHPLLHFSFLLFVLLLDFKVFAVFFFWAFFFEHGFDIHIKFISFVNDDVLLLLHPRGLVE